jgi:hypothetical protein
MNRRAFITVLAAVLAATPAAEAQQGGKLWRIGVLFGGRRSLTCPGYSHAVLFFVRSWKASVNWDTWKARTS